MIIETPALIRRGNYPQHPQSINILRVRAHNRIEGAAVYISADDETYRLVGSTRISHFGGTLLDELPSSGKSLVEQGPRITPLGPDLTTVQDLSSDPVNWRLGRQLAVFVNTLTNETEICFLRNVTVLSATEVRLDGLIRNRFDTEKATFPVDDTAVFVTTPSRGKIIADPLITPGATIYVKVVPRVRASAPLADISPQVLTLRGKGVVPMNTSKPWTRAPYPNNPFFKTGDDVELAVAYRSALALGTGSGAQPSGFPHGNAPVDGLLTWRIRNSILTLIKEVSTSEPTLAISNADLVDWFAGEPSEFVVGVVNSKQGYYSDEQQVTITRI